LKQYIQKQSLKELYKSVLVICLVSQCVDAEEQHFFVAMVLDTSQPPDSAGRLVLYDPKGPRRLDNQKKALESYFSASDIQTVQWVTPHPSLSQGSNLLCGYYCVLLAAFLADMSKSSNVVYSNFKEITHLLPLSTTLVDDVLHIFDGSGSPLELIPSVSTDNVSLTRSNY